MGGGNGQNSKTPHDQSKGEFHIAFRHPSNRLYSGDCVVFSPTNSYKTMLHRIISIIRNYTGKSPHLLRELTNFPFILVLLSISLLDCILSHFIRHPLLPSPSPSHFLTQLLNLQFDICRKIRQLNFTLFLSWLDTATL